MLEEDDDPEYEAWCAEQVERGELAGTPDTMACHKCHWEAGGKATLDDTKVPQRKVVKLGPIAEARRDPTQTYVLECGHTVI